MCVCESVGTTSMLSLRLIRRTVTLSMMLTTFYLLQNKIRSTHIRCVCSLKIKFVLVTGGPDVVLKKNSF